MMAHWTVMQSDVPPISWYVPNCLPAGQQVNAYIPFALFISFSSKCSNLLIHLHTELSVLCTVVRANWHWDSSPIYQCLLRHWECRSLGAQRQLHKSGLPGSQPLPEPGLLHLSGGAFSRTLSKKAVSQTFTMMWPCFAILSPDLHYAACYSHSFAMHECEANI